MESIDFTESKNNILLSNIHINKDHSDSINQEKIWYNMSAYPEKGYLEIKNINGAYRLAMESNAVEQAYAAYALRGEFQLYIKVLKNGYILANLLTDEYQLTLTCLGINKI